jgi:hypothetical protein
MRARPCPSQEGQVWQTDTNSSLSFVCTARLSLCSFTRLDPQPALNGTSGLVSFARLDPQPAHDLQLPELSPWPNVHGNRTTSN